MTLMDVSRISVSVPNPFPRGYKTISEFDPCRSLWFPRTAIISIPKERILSRENEQFSSFSNLEMSWCLVVEIKVANGMEGLFIGTNHIRILNQLKELCMDFGYLQYSTKNIH